MNVRDSSLSDFRRLEGHITRVVDSVKDGGPGLEALVENHLPNYWYETQFTTFVDFDGQLHTATTGAIRLEPGLDKIKAFLPAVLNEIQYVRIEIASDDPPATWFRLASLERVAIATVQPETVFASGNVGVPIVFDLSELLSGFNYRWLRLVSPWTDEELAGLGVMWDMRGIHI